MAEPTDQGAADRFPANADASCPFLSPVAEDSGPVKIRDISMAGISLLTSRRMEPGSLLAVTLANTLKGFTKTVLVRVTHVTTMTGGYLVGGSFSVPLTQQDLTALAR